MYAIVDLETTGGSTDNEAITEIAIYKYDGNELVDQFISMVNPERPIQPFVTRLTGINNKMLRKAPKFYEIAKRVIEITEGCTIVAHNASFDYRVLKKEFHRLGYDFKRPKLCTVKLSKEYITGQKSYSLGNLCKSLRIPITNRHRASGDALATVELFKLILNKNRDLSKHLEFEQDFPVKKSFGKDVVKMIDALPPKKGIIYIYDTDNHLLAVYNSRNIRKKIKNIYLNTNPKSLQLQKKIDKIDYEILSGRLINKIIPIHYKLKYNPSFTSCTNKRFNETIEFENQNFMIVDKGHITGEKSIIYVEAGKVIGYGFFKLNWQQQNKKLIKQRLTPIKDTPYIRKVIVEQLNKYKYLKTINFDDV